jgi:hypothetical protein
MESPQDVVFGAGMVVLDEGGGDSGFFAEGFVVVALVEETAIV